MPRKRKGVKVVLSKMSREWERSSLFRWMFERHDELKAGLDGRRLRWKEVCAWLESENVTDRTGKPATPETARKTWFRVRREIERQRALKEGRQPPKKKGPSRRSEDWRPEPVREPGVRVQGTAPAKPQAKGSAADVPASAPTDAGWRSLFYFKRDLAERSGRNPDDVKMEGGSSAGSRSSEKKGDRGR